jgi:hypothetical protein
MSAPTSTVPLRRQVAGEALTLCHEHVPLQRSVSICDFSHSLFPFVGEPLLPARSRGSGSNPLAPAPWKHRSRLAGGQRVGGGANALRHNVRLKSAASDIEHRLVRGVDVPKLRKKPWHVLARKLEAQSMGGAVDI